MRFRAFERATERKRGRGGREKKKSEIGKGEEKEGERKNCSLSSPLEHVGAKIRRSKSTTWRIFQVNCSSIGMYYKLREAIFPGERPDESGLAKWQLAPCYISVSYKKFTWKITHVNMGRCHVRQASTETLSRIERKVKRVTFDRLNLSSILQFRRKKKKRKKRKFERRSI